MMISIGLITLSTIYQSYVVQNKIINDYLVRVAFTGYENTAKAVGQIKKNDLQEVFREILILDSVLSDSINYADRVSMNYVNETRENVLVNGYTFSVENNYDTITDEYKMNYMAYIVLSQYMDYNKIEDYISANTDINYCAIAYYFMEKIFKRDILDIDRFSMYLGFYSELWCEYPPESEGSYNGQLGTSNRVGYSFKNETPEYFPSIRGWYDKGSSSTGLTTFDSTYVFSGVNIFGSTMSKSFGDSGDSMYGVIGFDILPYTNTSRQDDDLTKTLLFGPEDENFAYFILDLFDLNQLDDNKDTIINDMTRTVYSDEDEDDDAINEKIAKIKQSWSVNKIKSVNETDIIYASFYYGGQKYLFFTYLELLRIRTDNTYVREVTNVAAFIGNKDEVERSLNEITNELYYRLLEVYLFIALLS